LVHNPSISNLKSRFNNNAITNRLNEGFATYISYKGVKSAEPDWDTESAFLTDDLHGVLDLVRCSR